MREVQLGREKFMDCGEEELFGVDGVSCRQCVGV